MYAVIYLAEDMISLSFDDTAPFASETGSFFQPGFWDRISFFIIAYFNVYYNT